MALLEFDAINNFQVFRKGGAGCSQESNEVKDNNMVLDYSLTSLVAGLATSSVIRSLGGTQPSLERPVLQEGCIPYRNEIPNDGLCTRLL